MTRRNIGLAVAAGALLVAATLTAVTLGVDDEAQVPVATAGASTTLALLPGSVPSTAPPSTAAAAPSSTAAGRSAATTTQRSRSAPTSQAPPTVVTNPSVQDLQKLIDALTAQLQAPPTGSTTAPLTAEQVEAQVRELLKQLGITL